MFKFSKISKSLILSATFVFLSVSNLAYADYAIIPPSAVEKDGRVTDHYLSNVLIPMIRDGIKENSNPNQDFYLVDMKKGTGKSIVMVWRVKSIESQKQIMNLSTDAKRLCSYMDASDKQLLNMLDYMEQDYVDTYGTTIKKTIVKRNECR